MTIDANDNGHMGVFGINAETSIIKNIKLKIKGKKC